MECTATSPRPYQSREKVLLSDDSMTGQSITSGFPADAILDSPEKPSLQPSEVQEEADGLSREKDATSLPENGTLVPEADLEIGSQKQRHAYCEEEKDVPVERSSRQSPACHTWNDEKEILRIQAKRRARLEAGVRDSNLSAWAVATGCSVAKNMVERKNLATQLQSLVGDGTGKFLVLDKLADLLMTLRLPGILTKVRRYMREQKRRGDMVATPPLKQSADGSQANRLKAARLQGKAESMLFRPGMILFDDFLLLLGTDFKISNSCQQLRKAAVAHDRTRACLDTSTLFAEYRRHCILSGLRHHTYPNDPVAKKDWRLVLQLEYAMREANSSMASAGMTRRRRRSSGGSSTEGLLLLNQSVELTNSSTTTEAGTAMDVPHGGAPPLPGAASGAPNPRVLLKAQSSQEARRRRRWLRRRQDRAEPQQLREYLRVREMLATDLEQDPADFDVMKPMHCKLPAGDLLAGRQRRDKGLDIELRKDEAYARLLEAGVEARRSLKSRDSIRRRTARVTSGSSMSSSLTTRPSLQAMLGGGGGSTSLSSSCTATSTDIIKASGRSNQLRHLPATNAWGKPATLRRGLLGLNNASSTSSSTGTKDHYNDNDAIISTVTGRLRDQISTASDSSSSSSRGSMGLACGVIFVDDGIG